MVDTIGSRLKYAREQAQLKQKDVCESAEIPNIQTLSAYERDKNSPPISALKKLSQLYHVSIDWIVCGKESMHERQKETADYINELLEAIDGLGLYFSEEQDWNGNPTGEYVVYLRNSRLKGFNYLIDSLYKIYDIRDRIDSEDFQMLIQKKIYKCATESNNFEPIPPDTQNMQSIDDDLPF